MVLYLTSDIGGYYEKDNQRIPITLNNSNNFIENLKEKWPETANMLIICSDPDDFELNDIMKNVFFASFNHSGLFIDKIDVCDNRNYKMIQKIYKYDVILLLGGHVPTQNVFLNNIKLEKYIKNFEGIIIGISAGSMNCAKEVYAAPELDGESLDDDYERILDGLGLTEINVLPHYQYVKNLFLDGKRLYEEIIYPDSVNKEFYALNDGSFVLIENNYTKMFGEIYLIKNCNVEKINEKEQIKIFKK